jgi:hypothetical protein
MPINPLATTVQREIEAQALRLFESDALQQAMARLRPLFLADPRAATAAGRATLDQNLREIVFSAATCAVSMDPARPRVVWTINLPHRWFGLDVPGSRHGVDNPDNIYRVIALDDVSSYLVRGRVPPDPGPDVSFTVFSAYPGNGEDSHSLGVLTLAEIEVDGDGGFTLSVDPGPADGRRNHLQVNPGAKLLFVRDSMHDWSRESPLELEVMRVAGPPAAPIDESELAQRAVAVAERAVPYWIRSMPKWFGQRPHNVVPEAGATNFAYAKQASVGAQFRIAADEALVVTVDPMGAGYLGFQIADPWGASPDYVEHTSSLNAAQAEANTDGTISFVVAPADPMVHNWIDSAGLEEGTLMIRWQALGPGDIVTERSVRSVALVKQAELPRVLPAATRHVTPAERRAQIDARRAAYQRRLREQ